MIANGDHADRTLLLRCDVQLRDTNIEAAENSRSFLVRVAVGLAALIGVVSFVSLRGSGGSTTGSTTTGVSTTSPIGVADLAPSTSIDAEGITPTAVLSLPPEAIPLVGLRTPQSAARNLWDAWRDQDRPRALLYASVEAVDKLFDWTWVPQVRQAGCTPLEKNWLCRFEGPKQRWDATIRGDADAGYRVTAVRVAEPAGDLLTPAELPGVTNTVPTITNPDGAAVQLGPTLPDGITLPSTVPSAITLVPLDATRATGADGSTVSVSTTQQRRASGSVTTIRQKRAASSQPKNTQPPETAPATADATAPRKVEPPAEEPATGPVPVQGGTTPVPLEP